MCPVSLNGSGGRMNGGISTLSGTTPVPTHPNRTNPAPMDHDRL